MSGIIYSVSTGALGLSAAAPTTAIQIAAPATNRAKVHGFSVAFNGVSATAEPIAVKLVRQSTAGTMTAASKRILNGVNDAPQATATINSSVNPSASEIVFETLVHPQGGLHMMFPPELMPVIQASGRFGLSRWGRRPSP